MTADETDARFYAGPSSIAGAGEGLFAATDLAAGDRLEVIGVLVTRDSIADRCTGYADAYKLRVGDRLLIPVGWAAKVNHRDRHNVQKVVDGDRLFLEVTEPVARGSELFLRYHDYAVERLGVPVSRAGAE